VQFTAGRAGGGLVRSSHRCGVLAVAALLSGCAATTPAVIAPSRSAAATKALSVVASTNVYADIVRHIAGTSVEVKPLISDPAQDPHSYQANARDRLALSRASVVIENGGGYDDFVDAMLRGFRSRGRTVINVVTLSGKDRSADGTGNEHVWYDIPTVRRLVVQLAGTLAAAEPAGAATFHENAARYDAELERLAATEANIRSTAGGAGVAITEPAPLYLLAACGLVNKTPAEFSDAVEAGVDVSPRVLEETLGLVSAHQVRLVVYNEQTMGPETRKLLAAAASAHVPVVPVSETLPAGANYVGWMSGTLAAIGGALSVT
jgi:zinc/manganese transport system substrate-binding protein